MTETGIAFTQDVTNAKPLIVSAIVTTKNEEVRLEALLRSIKSQSYPNIELIVVDNNSTDNTKEIAGRYTNKVYNYGPEGSAQRNYAVSMSTGDYVLILDADMELTPNVIRDCVEAVKSQPEIKALVIPEESFGQGY